MADDDDTDLQIMARFAPRTAQTGAGRLANETRAVAYPDRRATRSTGRTAQLNLKCRPAFREHVAALARKEGRMMIEIIEAALALYEQTRGKQ